MFELRKRLLLVVPLLAAAACGRDGGREAAPGIPEPSVAEAPPIRVHPDEKHIYRYFPPGQREPRSVKTPEQVPAEARDMVLVSPSNAEAPPGLEYVADLREQLGDGSYPYRVVRSTELERTLNETRGTSAAQNEAAEDAREQRTPAAAAGTSTKPVARTAGAESDVILFATSWCGACAQARRWLRNKEIPYVERDIEKEPDARAEMERLADESGFPRAQLRGVPVFWVKGKMFSGFDPGSIERAL